MSGLENLKASINIEEVISEFVVLKKKGQNFWAKCPFHLENTPSFSVSPVKGFYKCFGCGVKGDAFTFLMDLEGMSFMEAVKYLGKKYNIKIENNFTKNTADTVSNNYLKESLYILYSLSNDYFHSKLKNKEALDIAFPYLKTRNFNDKTIKKFQIGYSLSLWDDLFKEMKKKDYGEEILFNSGLFIKSKFKNSNNHYDLFRKRIIFPIHNIYGKVIAFAGRKLDNKEEGPKYINSPESLIYNKSKTLYGLFFAKEYIKKNDFCYIVEGYTDLISMYEKGIKNVVASGGTSLTDNHIKLLSRFTKNIILLFDNDEAGVKASYEAINKILSQDLDVKIITLPKNEDPDSFVKKNEINIISNYFEENSTDFIKYKLKKSTNTQDNDIFSKGNIIKDIINSISLIPDTIKKTLYINKVSKILNIDEGVLLSTLNKILSEKNNQFKFETSKIDFNNFNIKKLNIDDKLQKTEKDIIYLLLKYGNEKIDEGVFLKDYILEELKTIKFTDVNYNSILQEFKNSKNEELNVTSDYFLKKESNIKNLVIDLLATKIEISPMWESKFYQHIVRETDDLKKTTFISILKLKLNILKKLIKENSLSMKNQKSQDELNQKFKIHKYLKDREKEIVKLLNINSIECF